MWISQSVRKLTTPIENLVLQQSLLIKKQDLYVIQIQLEQLQLLSESTQKASSSLKVKQQLGNMIQDIRRWLSIVKIAKCIQMMDLFDKFLDPQRLVNHFQDAKNRNKIAKELGVTTYHELILQRLNINERNVQQILEVANEDRKTLLNMFWDFIIQGNVKDEILYLQLLIYLLLDLEKGPEDIIQVVGQSFSLGHQHQHQIFGAYFLDQSIQYQSYFPFSQEHLQGLNDENIDYPLRYQCSKILLCKGKVSQALSLYHGSIYFQNIQKSQPTLYQNQQALRLADSKFSSSMLSLRDLQLLVEAQMILYREKQAAVKAQGSPSRDWNIKSQQDLNISKRQNQSSYQDNFSDYQNEFNDLSFVVAQQLILHNHQLLDRKDRQDLGVTWVMNNLRNDDLDQIMSLQMAPKFCRVIEGVCIEVCGQGYGKEQEDPLLRTQGWKDELGQEFVPQSQYPLIKIQDDRVLFCLIWRIIYHLNQRSFEKSVVLVLKVEQRGDLDSFSQFSSSYDHKDHLRKLIKEVKQRLPPRMISESYLYKNNYFKNMEIADIKTDKDVQRQQIDKRLDNELSQHIFYDKQQLQEKRTHPNQKISHHIRSTSAKGYKDSMVYDFDAQKFCSNGRNILDQSRSASQISNPKSIDQEDEKTFIGRNLGSFKGLGDVDLDINTEIGLVYGNQDQQKQCVQENSYGNRKREASWESGREGISSQPSKKRKT